MELAHFSGRDLSSRSGVPTVRGAGLCQSGSELIGARHCTPLHACSADRGARTDVPTSGTGRPQHGLGSLARQSRASWRTRPTSHVPSTSTWRWDGANPNPAQVETRPDGPDRALPSCRRVAAAWHARRTRHDTTRPSVRPCRASREPARSSQTVVRRIAPTEALAGTPCAPSWALSPPEPVHAGQLRGSHHRAARQNQIPPSPSAGHAWTTTSSSFSCRLPSARRGPPPPSHSRAGCRRYVYTNRLFPFLTPTAPRKRTMGPLLHLLVPARAPERCVSPYVASGGRTWLVRPCRHRDLARK